MKDKVYIFQDEKNNYYKIGFTSRNPLDRLKEIQTGNPNKIGIHSLFDGNKELESYIHTKYKNKRLFGEWFSLDEKDIKDINNICAKYNSPQTRQYSTGEVIQLELPLLFEEQKTPVFLDKYNSSDVVSFPIKIIHFMRERKITPNEISLLLLLKSLDREGMSQENISKHTGISLRQVKKYLPSLQAKGYITLFRKTPNSRAVYTVNF